MDSKDIAHGRHRRRKGIRSTIHAALFSRQNSEINADLESSLRETEFQIAQQQPSDEATPYTGIESEDNIFVTGLALTQRKTLNAASREKLGSKALSRIPD